MKKLSCLLLLLACVTLLLPGCWSRRDIELSGFVALAAIDATEGDEIELTVQFVITEALGPEGGGGGEGPPVWTVSAKGKNIAEAVNELRSSTGRVPIWSHTEAIIFGEELAKKGLAPVLDYMMRQRELRLTTWVMVSDGSDAKDILETTPKITLLPSRYVRDLIDLTKETSISRPLRLIEFLRVLIDERGSEPWLPLVKAKPKKPVEGTQAGGGQGGEGTQEGEGKPEGEEKPEALVLEGMAIFQADRLVGKLNGLETRGVLLLRGEAERATIQVEVPGQGFVVQGATFARRTLRVRPDGDQVSARISVFEEGDIVEHSLPQVELNPQAIRELDQLLTAVLEQEVNAAMAKLQELGTDVIGIGTRLYRLHPKVFHSLDWEQVFPTIPVEITVEANFRRLGGTLQSPLSKEALEGRR